MQAASNNNVPPELETGLRQIRAHLDRSEFAQALRHGLTLRPATPHNRDLLYMIAVSQRYLQLVPDALSTLAELEKHHPTYSRLFQERGHCHVVLRDAQPAIEAFVRAIDLNPSLPASWNALQALYRMTGRPADAQHAADQVAHLSRLPAEICTAFSMYADGEIADAEQTVRRYLLQHGDHVEGMRLLAKIGTELDVLDDAEILLERALALAPDHVAARYEYAVVLLKRHRHTEAETQLLKLLEAEPQNPAYRTTLATARTGFGDFEQALPLYRALLEESPLDPELHLSIAHALKTLGHTEEAVQSYRAAAAARPYFGEAYWSLANLKTYRFTEEEIARMRRDEASPDIRIADRYSVCFALGKALEDLGQYAESFIYYARGNALKKSECRYKPEPLERNARLQASTCTREFFEARRGFGSSDRSPIFIVGLPRSGSTLLEQILASHSEVEGTMELADVPRLVQELQGRETYGGNPRYPGILASMSSRDYAGFAQKYLADTRVYRTSRPRFIDKMPNNFRHLGLIHLMFPNAAIIDARRAPMACCFSNFKQLFASGQQFTYSVEDIARYYRMYVDLMTHWDEALPGRVLRVQHEDVVLNLESNVRRILEFCELGFEPSCVDFHKTRRTVHTASSEQVRRPINTEGIDQWRHYEPWLGDFKIALAPVVGNEQREKRTPNEL